MAAAGALSGQTALITGGTDGIGKATARLIALAGADVILVGRNAEKGAQAVREVGESISEGRVTFWAYDLAQMREVERLAEAIRTNAMHLTMLVQSAGVMRPHRTLTPEGLETVFAVQYLARFHLTRLLLERGAQPRIVSVSAGGTMPIRLDFDNLNGERFYNGVYALIHESVANDLFALRLIRQRPDVRFYGYGPFYVRSGLFTEMPGWFKLLTGTVGRLMATTPEAAAQDILSLLTSAHPSGLYSRHLKPIRPSRYRADPVVQDRLWTVSEQMVTQAVQSAG